MADVGVSNLHYADASLSVAAGILPLADGGLFQLSRPVSGAEAIDADHPNRAPLQHVEMSVLTPANQLTLMRVLLVPAFVILTVYGYFGWALIVFAVAGLTDLLDGLIARRFSRRTSLGAWLDPMADKLLIVATVSVLTLPGLGLVNKLPVWLTILIISRDLLIVLTVAVINLAIGRREFRPSIYGKIATATYIITCVMIMYFNYLQRHLDRWSRSASMRRPSSRWCRGSTTCST